MIAPDESEELKAAAMQDLAYCHGAKAAMIAEGRGDKTLAAFEESLELRRAEALRVLQGLKRAAAESKARAPHDTDGNPKIEG